MANDSELTKLSTPGTRLWVLPVYSEQGFTGLGEPATAIGTHVSAVEKLFGSGNKTVHYRTDSGRENSANPLVLLTLADARTHWWVTDGKGNLITGGHTSKTCMLQLAAEKNGVVQQGSEFIPQ